MEKNYVVNVKNKQGTIFTFRGDTALELNKTISDFVDAGLEFAVANVEAVLLGITTQAPSVVATDPIALIQASLGAEVVSEVPRQQAPFAPVAPPVQPPAPAVGDKACIHGTMVKRTGNGAKGEWRGYFCPTPKGTADQC